MLQVLPHLLVQQCYLPSAGSVTQARHHSSSLLCGGHSVSLGGLTLCPLLLLFVEEQTRSIDNWRHTWKQEQKFPMKK